LVSSGIWICGNLSYQISNAHPIKAKLKVITYVILYFAGMGGMIGIASKAGQGWMISAITLFFVAGILAFVQRAVTGF
jgi:hypothetical protein